VIVGNGVAGEEYEHAKQSERPDSAGRQDAPARLDPGLAQG
jgi:hypothetical protein